jgi:N-methylhydantoinase B
LVELDVLVPAEYSYRGEGSNAQTSFGAAGGQAGDKGSCGIVFRDGRNYTPPQYGVERLEPLRLTISSAGGGGYGDPRIRDPQRVRDDVRDGLVSPEAARTSYGVVLGPPPDYAIDQEATAALRAD